MTYTKRELEKALNLETIESDFQIELNYNTEGPGYLDLLLALNGQENCWVQEENSSKSQSIQKKIIFSNALVNDIPLQPQELSFISALVRHFEVYLWQGVTKTFADCKPLVSSSEFWKARHTIVGATEEAVKDILAQQGLPLDEFYILDFVTYTHAIKDKASFIDAALFDITSKQIREKLFTNIDPKDFKLNVAAITKDESLVLRSEIPQRVNSLLLSDMTDYDLFITDLLASAETLKITKLASGEWRETNTFYDDFIKSFISLNKIHGPALAIALFNSENVHVSGVEHESVIILLKGNGEIVIENSQLQTLLITTSISRKKMVIKNCHKLTNFGCVGNYHELTIEACDISKIDFSNFSNAKKIRLVSLPKLQRIDLSSNTCLEELEIENCENLKSIKNIKSTVLKNLRIYSCANLVNLDISQEQIERLNLLQLVGNGEDVSFDGLNYVNLAMPDLVSLEAEMIEFLDLSKYPKLMHAEIFFIVPRKDLFRINNPELMSLMLPTLPSVPQDLVCKSLRELTFYRLSEEMVDLRSLPKLTNLVCSDGETKSLILKSDTVRQVKISEFSNLTSLDLRDLKKLSEVTIEFSKNLKTLLYDGDSLEKLYLQQINLSLLSRGITKKLKSLTIDYCDDVDFNSLDLSDLEELSILCCNVKSLAKIGLNKLKRLSIWGCKQLAKIDLSDLKSLEDLEIGDFGSVHIVCHDLPELRHILLEDVTASLDIDLLDNLETMKIVNSLISYDFGYFQCKNLKSFTADKSRFSGPVDFRKCPNLLEILITDSKNVPKQLVVNVESLQYLKKMILSEPKTDLFIEGIEDCEQLKLLVWASKNAQTEIPNIKDKLPSSCKLILKNSLQEEIIASTKNNPISVYQNIDQCSIDSITGSPKPHVAQGEFKVSFYSSKAVNRDAYQIFVYDKITFKNNKIQFLVDYSKLISSTLKLQLIDKNTFAKLREEVNTDPNKELACVEIGGNLRKNKLYPLAKLKPLTHETDVDFYVDSLDAIDLHWHTEEKQFYFSCREKVSSLKILYINKNNSFYPASLPTDSRFEEESLEELLPEDLSSALIKKLENHKPLQFLFKNKVDINTKIHLLIQYCKKFEVEDLDNAPNDELDILCDLIKFQKGVCRHRAIAFVILARLIGIRARLITNEEHAFCTVPFVKPSGKKFFSRIDLGGGARQDLTPSNIRTSSFPLVQESKSDKSKSIRSLPNKYNGYFEEAVRSSTLSSIDDILNAPHIFSPLIELKPGEDPLAINKTILQQLKEKKFEVNAKYLYVHSPEEFAQYLHPWEISNGEYSKLSDGPLNQLIKNDGLLVVNWTNFSPKQIASYKSLLDTQPTLMGLSVSKKLKIVGLINTKTQSCSAFYSRNKRWLLDEKFILKTVITKNNQTLPEVDLFQSKMWKEDLLGKVKMTDKGMVLEDGPLIKAIKENKSLTLVNPPKSNEFDLLLHRVLDERKILFNGKLLEVSDNFQVQIAHKQHALKLKNVMVSGKDSILKKNRIYLGLYNFHECFDIFSVHNGRGQSRPGLLHNYDESNQVFYITENIPKSHWQKLLSYIKDKYPNRRIHFQVSAGCEIESVFDNQDTSKSVNMLTSSDSDFTTLQFVAKQYPNSNVFDITPQTKFSELIGKISISQPSHKKSIQFSYIKSQVFQALINGETVILNGEMSNALRQQLLPLFSESPHVYLNGERIEVKGKLISIAPAVKPKISYDFDDYAKVLTEEDKHNVPYLKKLKKFYKMANQLPNKDSEKLGKPVMSYKRLSTILKLLKADQPLHVHNPIKGVFHYDYAKDSQEYAYLNVIAKYFFDKDPNGEIRRAKLTSLVMTRKIKNKADIRSHAWKILNCLNANDIKTILGDNFKNLVKDDKNIPLLTNSALKKLQEIVFPKKPYIPEKRVKKDYAKKHAEQLTKLLTNPDIYLILLKGMPGVGKTHTIRKLLGKYYDGEANILEWLQKGGNLLLDEANLAKPGTWDFLKGLSRNKKQVYYQGTCYSLTDKHKIIATGNPESYPGRNYHALFQNYAETLYFQTPDDNYLENTILKSLLEPRGLFHKKYTDVLLFAYHLVQKHNIFFVASIRDLENICQRFMTLVVGEADVNKIQDALLMSCIGEFAGSIKNDTERKVFINELECKLIAKYETSNKLLKINDSLSIPASKQYILQAIDQDLAIRERLLKEGYFYFKPCIVLEGESGLGKSTLIKAKLESAGFTQESQDTQKKYYEISAGSSEVYATLKKAFHEGAVIILDEINIDENLEVFLNQLLTGYDEHGKSATKPGFMVFASQNPGHYDGRFSLSPALRNRSHFLYMDKMSELELEALASQKVSSPKEFVEAFINSSKKHPEAVNMRTFYNVLDRVHAEEAKLKTKCQQLREIINFSPYWKQKAHYTFSSLPVGIYEMQEAAKTLVSDEEFFGKVREIASKRLAVNTTRDMATKSFYAELIKSNDFLDFNFPYRLQPLEGEERKACNQLREMLSDKAYWKSKSHFSLGCPAGISEMQKANESILNDELFYHSVRKIAEKRLLIPSTRRDGVTADFYAMLFENDSLAKLSNEIHQFRS